MHGVFRWVNAGHPVACVPLVSQFACSHHRLRTPRMHWAQDEYDDGSATALFPAPNFQDLAIIGRTITGRAPAATASASASASASVTAFSAPSGKTSPLTFCFAHAHFCRGRRPRFVHSRLLS